MLEGHIKRKEAMEILMSNWEPEQLSREDVPVRDACGRILAESQYSLYDFPVYRASSMDGIAVNYDLIENGIPDTSGWQKGVEYVRADTGDDFDDRYDTVIPVEWVSWDDDGRIHIELQNDIERGNCVSGAGSRMKKDELLVSAGMRLAPFNLSRLAAGGITSVPVYRKPMVAFLPTGSELIPLGETPVRGNNIDSNSIMAEAEIEAMGAEPLMYSITKDMKDELRHNLLDAVSKADIVIINGGSSKGEEDFNTGLMQESGQLLFHWVRTAPGRPMSAAMIDGIPVINLAGPTTAALSGLKWVIKPMLQRMTGEDPDPFVYREAVLAKDMKSPPLDLFKLVRLYESEGVLYADEIERGSSEVSAANGYFITDHEKREYNKGDHVLVGKL